MQSMLAGEPLRTLRCVRARGINVTGPGSMFDESPKEPIPDEVRRMSAQLMESMKEKVGTVSS